jgi:hypothetical protein
MRSIQVVRIASAVLPAAFSFAGCATPPGGAFANEDASYGLSVAAELRVAGSQQAVARCLRYKENSASYPQGVAPGFTATETEGTTVRITQWFFLKRGATWATRFDLRPLADGATIVQVILPIELYASQAYQRAAVELIAHCQANLAHADY